MTILHPCPGCENIFVFTEAQAFTTVQCPQCGIRFRVQQRFLQFSIQTPKRTGGPVLAYHQAVDLQMGWKVLLRFPPRPVLDDPEYHAWLENQANLFTEFQHPHAVPFFGMVKSHGEACLLWEDPDGTTLSARMKTVRRLPEQIVLRIALQVASALQAAAELEYFHGTVNPAQIYLDDAGDARLVGIGFPFPITEEIVKQEAIYYLAPECLSDIGDWRSDIYGLGACMFHALAGYPPMAASPDTHLDVIQKMKRMTMPIPVMNPPVSASTTLLLKRMLAGNPEERISSYDELMASLQTAYEAAAASPGVPVNRQASSVVKSAVPAGARPMKRSAAITGLLGRLFQAKRSQ